MAEIKLDYGLNIAAKAPVDKRIVVNSLADLYTKSTFDYVYAGLTVSVLNSHETLNEDGTYTYTGEPTLWILADVSPYDFGTDIILDHDNYTNYWKKVNGGSSDSEQSAVMYWDDLDLDGSSDSETL